MKNVGETVVVRQSPRDSSWFDRMVREFLSNAGYDLSEAAVIPDVMPPLKAGPGFEVVNPPDAAFHSARCEWCRLELVDVVSGSDARADFEEARCVGCNRLGCDFHVQTFAFLSPDPDINDDEATVVLHTSLSHFVNVAETVNPTCLDCHARLVTGIVRLMIDHGLIPQVVPQTYYCSSPGCPLPMRFDCSYCLQRYCEYHFCWRSMLDEPCCIGCIYTLVFAATQREWLTNKDLAERKGRMCPRCGRRHTTDGKCDVCGIVSCEACLMEWVQPAVPAVVARSGQHGLNERVVPLVHMDCAVSAGRAMLPSLPDGAHRDGYAGEFGRLHGSPHKPGRSHLRRHLPGQ